MDNTIKTKKINSCLSGEITIPPDKSISHRSLIIGALTGGKIRIKNLSLGNDCISTLRILSNLGIKHEFISKRELILDSSKGFIEPKAELDCGNSGTTARLLSGVLAGQSFKSVLIGDESLQKRPMKRIIEPLSLMGARIKSNNNKLPLEIEGAKLSAIEYLSPIPSAQVKSSILLAGLNSPFKTRVYEKTLSRNHSEIMLKYLGAKINCGKDEKGYYCEIEKSDLEVKDIEITGDISSAAFFMVACALVKNSCVLIKNVGLNPTRSGILDIFNQAKINYRILNKRLVCAEPAGDIEVKYTENISPFEIKGDLIPRLIDEIPILALLAAFAKGKSTISDAKDLRNKESDRIKTIVAAFSSLGIDITEKEDGFIINGGDRKNLNKGNITLETFLDHRLAMTYYILSLIYEGELEIKGFDCIKTSFPEFLDLFNQLTA